MRLADLLGIELPIIQAPMAGVHGHALSAAVSGAGGLGSIPCAMLDVHGVRRELGAHRALTDGPVNLNFFCHQPQADDEGASAAWLRALAPYYDELGLSPHAASKGPAREPFNLEMLELIEEQKPEVVSFHFGLPPLRRVEAVKQTGAVVLGCATTLEEAKWLAERGVDAIVAQGIEAGGHRGLFLSHDLATQRPMLELTAEIANGVSVPVIAAGGIADAADVSRALSAGACGVQVGTAYLLCPEASTSPLHRAKLASPEAAHTEVTNLLTGRPARGIRNRLMAELGPLSPLPPAFPLAAAALAPLRAEAERRGNADFSPLWAGVNARRCREIAAAQLTRELAGLSHDG